MKWKMICHSKVLNSLSRFDSFPAALHSMYITWLTCHPSMQPRRMKKKILDRTFQKITFLRLYVSIIVEWFWGKKKRMMELLLSNRAKQECYRLLSILSHTRFPKVISSKWVIIIPTPSTPPGTSMDIWKHLLHSLWLGSSVFFSLLLFPPWTLVLFWVKCRGARQTDTFTGWLRSLQLATCQVPPPSWHNLFEPLLATPQRAEPQPPLAPHDQHRG